MTAHGNYIIGTSGYSFADWPGTFYPPGTRKHEMFSVYVRHFQAVEINYTFYRLPVARTMESIAARAPEGFVFWVKLNQAATHHGDRGIREAFLAGIEPITDTGRLAGLLLQFPQRFHRTVANRRFLAEVLDDYAPLPRAVEFRHASWAHPSVAEGFRERGVTLVVPDVPDLPGLYRVAPLATTRTGYLRLHSRRADRWYAGGGAARYDYDYSDGELRELVAAWDELGGQVDEVYVFFNNCHRGQAARNAEALRRILGQI